MKHVSLMAMLIANLAIVAPAALAEEAEIIRLSEPTQVSDTHELFGAPLPEEGEVLDIADLVENSDAYQGQDVLVETRIAKVCQAKGCFFVAQHEADTVRVKFKDYGFFIPTDSGGKTVLLAGRFERKALSREEAEHLAEDLGEAAPESVPEYQYLIVATGVSIPRG